MLVPSDWLAHLRKMQSIDARGIRFGLLHVDQGKVLASLRVSCTLARATDLANKCDTIYGFAHPCVHGAGHVK